MPAETEPVYTNTWQEEHPWLSEPTMPDQDEDTPDEITHSAPDELRIA